jgi:hypothetical protein
MSVRRGAGEPVESDMSASAPGRAHAPAYEVQAQVRQAAKASVELLQLLPDGLVIEP